MNLQTLKNRNGEKGFTIVELLIVIVVIAILAAISIVAYTGIQNRSRASAAASLATQVAKKADAYYAVQSSYPTGTTTSALQTAFNGVPEANLEGLSITYTATQPTGTALTDSNFTNGRTVYYQPSSTGYTVWYWTNETSGTDVVAANLKRIQK